MVRHDRKQYRHKERDVFYPNLRYERKFNMSEILLHTKICIVSKVCRIWKCVMSEPMLHTEIWYRVSELMLHVWQMSNVRIYVTREYEMFSVRTFVAYSPNLHSVAMGEFPKMADVALVAKIWRAHHLNHPWFLKYLQKFALGGHCELITFPIDSNGDTPGLWQFIVHLTMNVGHYNMP